jgi:spore coat protein CotH
MRQRFLIGLCILSGFCVKAQTTFYDQAKIQKIEIFFNQANWDQQLDTAKMGKEGFIMAKLVKINGKTFDSVGVKYKGNSSFDSTYKKNPLHIELNSYKSQDYEGLEDIKLSNGYADPSMVREVLAYDLLKNYMKCPESNFAQLYINGIYIGVYSNSESINKTFCAQHFYNDIGTFVKGNPQLTPSPSVKSNLKFIPGDSSGYFNYYEMKADHGWKDLAALCDSITNKPSNISSVLNVDAAIWMLAFNNLFVNLDSYSGAFAQNYYLYKDANGLYNPIIWDLNMCFGGFPFLGSSNSSLGSLSIANMQAMPAGIHSTDVYWPLIKAIYSNSQYKKMYLAHLKTMTNEMVQSGTYLSRYNYFKSVADTAVQKDSRKFYSNTDYQNALTANISVGSYSVPGIQTLMSARNTFLQSTSDFTLTSPSITTPTTGAAKAGQNCNISVSVNNADVVYLGYRSSSSATFSRIAMWDDGLHNDGQANDKVFAAQVMIGGNHTQYYIYAENSNAGAFLPARAEHEFFQIDIYPPAKPGQVSINEFLANNKNDVTNEFHITEDWIELYNNSASPVSLSGMYLSDDRNQRAKYKFPANTIIKGEDLLIVWADEFSGGSQLHSGFKLNEEGDNIILSDGLKNVFDAYSFGIQEKDISMARCPDGDGPFIQNKRPSYRLFNCLVGVDEKILSEGNVLIYPNPASEKFTVKFNSLQEKKIMISDLLGKVLYEDIFTFEKEIDLQTYPAGVYLVTCDSQTAKLIISK